MTISVTSLISGSINKIRSGKFHEQQLLCLGNPIADVVPKRLRRQGVRKHVAELRMHADRRGL
jgi:hypothetical protein